MKMNIIGMFSGIDTRADFSFQIISPLWNVSTAACKTSQKIMEYDIYQLRYKSNGNVNILKTFFISTEYLIFDDEQAYILELA